MSNSPLTPMQSSKSSDGSGLTRELGLFDSSMVVVGTVIGSGIFLTAGLVAQSLPSAPLILLAWLVGGLLTIAGALTFAELGASMPQVGGLYVYLREAYGRMAGFLYGWICFLVYQTGSVAALAAGFASLSASFFPKLGRGNEKTIAIAVIVLLTAVHYLGIKFGKWVQNILTMLKIGALIGLVIFGVSFGESSPLTAPVNPFELSVGQLLMGFGLAQVSIAWSYGGWSNLSFLAGEVRNPQHTLPKALVVGTVIVTLLYVATNYVYLAAVPLNEMMGTLKIAESATRALFGGATATIVTAVALAAILGSLNGVIFSGPRVFYAMAQDKLFFKKAAEIHPRFGSPAFALILQALWASVLTISGSFEQLLTFTMFIGILFWTAGAIAVPILRRRKPSADLPYRTWGYPVVSFAFIVASTGILINTLIERPFESIAGIALMATGLPVYWFWYRSGRQQRRSHTSS